MTSRGGSHGGRGFRYQDAVASWLSAVSWANAGDWGIVIPEGGDDVELDGGALTFVQVKSRREHLGAFSPSEVAGFIEELWDRAEKAFVAPQKLVLVLERPVRDEAFTPGAFAPLPATVLANLTNDPRLQSLGGWTELVVAPSPQEAAISLIQTKSGSTPLSALVCYGELLSKVGALSDANGLKSAGSYEGLSRSDVESLLTNMLGALDPSALEAAVAAGLCEPVDFITPLKDPNFYLGVDVEPGHLAAGLVEERPAARELVAAALEARGNALVVGPSGAGKSALMWETARALRHSVRWFRVRRLTEPDVPLLRRLAQTFRANAASPIGFVLDDVGRLGPEAWSQLARETPAQSGVLLLGSVREEDVFILNERARAEEVRPAAQPELAERMWRALSDAGQTKWDGWLEPWNQSKGLLLEYAFILSQGERLDAVLQQQVAARISDAKRDDEIAILRVSACAGAAGARLDVGKLGVLLGISEQAMARALQRLVSEHLISEVAPGLIGGLHQVRSEGLMRAALTAPPPTYAETLARAMHAAPAGDLERLVTDALLRREAPLKDVYAAAQARLEDSKDASEFAAILRGLASAFIASRVTLWLETPEAKAVPRTQITSAARMGVAKIDFAGLPFPAEITKAAKALTALMGDGSDPRHGFVSSLPDALLGALVSGSIGLVDLERICAAFMGGALPKSVQEALRKRTIDVGGANLNELRSLLGTMSHIDRDVAKAWIGPEQEQQMLKRLAAEWPWAGEAVLREEGGAINAACDYWYVAQSHQPKAHDDVVALCEAMLGLLPRADISVSRAVAVNGMVAGYAHIPMADKRIARENLPAKSLPEWNRRWIAAIADRVAADSYTSYLSGAVALLDEVPASLVDMIDRRLRGKAVSPAQIQRAEGLLARVKELTPPRSSAAEATGTGDGDINREVTALQNVLFSCCAEIIIRFNKLPENAGADIAYLDDLLNHIDTVEKQEPWTLLSLDGPPPSLAALLTTLERIRLITGEAAARNVAPDKTWSKVGASAKSGNGLRLVAMNAQTAATKRFEDKRNKIKADAAQVDPDARVFVRPYPEGILPWPPVEVLGVLEAEDTQMAMLALTQSQIALRTVVDPIVRLTLIPVVRGFAVPRFAQSGHDTLLGLPGQSADWVESEGYPLAKHPAADAFDQAGAFAGELASMDKLGLGTPERPQVEQDVRATLATKYEEALVALKSGVTQFEQEFGEDVVIIVEGIRSGEIDLPAEVQKQLMGEESKAAVTVGMTLALIIQAELEAAASAPA